MHWAWFVAIGAAAGWWVGRTGKESGLGILGDLGFGAVGGLVGGLATRGLTLSDTAAMVAGGVMAAVVGIVLVLFVRKATRSKAHVTTRTRDGSGRRTRY